MKGRLLETRIPTVLGIILLVVGLVVTSFFAKTGVILNSRASSEQTPQDIRISNITDSSFTVSYRTIGSVSGEISLGKDSKTTQSYFDDRFTQGSAINSFLHYITVKNLQPQTTYFFTIINGSNTFLNNGSPFSVITGAQLGSLPTQGQITGSLISSDGTQLVESIVYIKSDTSQILSTLVTNGQYTVSLNNLRNQDLSSYDSIAPSDLLHMDVIDATDQSTVTLFANQETKVPTIIISKNYDFTVSNPVSTINIASSSASEFTLIASNAAISQKTEILSPENGQGYTDQQPTFRGTAPPGSKVQVIIHSTQTMQTEVQTDSSGFWSYRPVQSLSPGQHTITISTQDPSGIIKQITQSFVVYASGNQINQPATPSATPTIVISTPTPTPTTVLIPTATPIIQTVTIAIPTPTPTQPIIISSIPKPTTISPGSSVIENVGGASIAVSIFGILLFLLTRALL